MGRVDCSLTVRTESSRSLSTSSSSSLSNEEHQQPQASSSHPAVAYGKVALATKSVTTPEAITGKQSPVDMIAVTTNSHHRLHHNDNDVKGPSSSSTSALLADDSVSAAAAVTGADTTENGNQNENDDPAAAAAAAAAATTTTTTTPASNTDSTESSQQQQQQQLTAAAAFYGGGGKGIRQDSRDEEEGEGDDNDVDSENDNDDNDIDCDSSSLGYSDDSASLSDVYFHPQPGDNLSRPGIIANRYSSYHHRTGDNTGSPVSFDPLYPSPPPLLLQLQQQQQPMYGYMNNMNQPAQQFPLSSYYGSMGAAAAATAQHAYHSHSSQTTTRMQSPPMAIQEDSPLLLLAPPSSSTNDSTIMTIADGVSNGKTATTNHYHRDHYDIDSIDSLTMSTISNNNKSSSVVVLSKKEQRRRRKYQQRQHAILTLRQREQVARERAVHQIKGQLQLSETWQDLFWAVLFIIQLIIVLALAVRYGWYFYKLNSSSSSTTAARVSSSSWHGYGVNNKFHYWQRRGRLFSPTFDDGNSDDYYNINNNDTIATTTDTDSNTTTATTYNYHDNNDVDDDFMDFTIDYKNVVALTFCVGFYVWIITYLSFGFMLIVARSLIQIMLIGSIILALVWGIVGLLLFDPYGIISLMGFTALLSTLGYTMYSWNRIPFAATNLYTALCALRCTADITVLGLISLIVAFGWCLFWTVAFIGVVNSNTTATYTADCDLNHFNDCGGGGGDGDGRIIGQGRYIPIYLLLLLSFHWTNMVIKNIVRVTVASAIGTWWFHPPTQLGPRFCTAAVLRPLGRACTKSLGSISVGSLMIQPAQLLKVICRLCCCINVSTTTTTNHQNYPFQQYPNLPSRFSSTSTSASIGLIGSSNGSNGSSSTPTTTNGATNNSNVNVNTDDANETSGLVHDQSFRIDSPADSVNLSHRIGNMCWPLQHTLRSCNRWAFTYIGMYNYSFLDAGEKAIQLFETRQWMEVVEDSLIHNVLLMASVVIGGSAGVFAVVVEETDGFEFTSFHQPMFSAFVIGSVLGYVLSNILLLGVVGSAVNTVLVCFAAGPFEFDKNHSRLSREMREVWSQQVWEPAPTTVASPAAVATAATKRTTTASNT